MSNIAFLDTNVLKHIVTNSSHGQEIINLLNNKNIQIVTFKKCLYEIYSMIRMVAIKDLNNGRKNKDDPINNLFLPKISKYSKILRKHKIEQKNVEYWFNLSQEWEGWEFFSRQEEHIEKYIKDNAEKILAKEDLELKKDFIKWKAVIREFYDLIDTFIEKNNIRVYNYSEVYSSEWYKDEGYLLEINISKNCMLPNEDFEIIIAAIFSKSKVFITNETKNNGIVMRGAISSNISFPLCFCNSKKLEEAIDSDFILRFYHESN